MIAFGVSFIHQYSSGLSYESQIFSRKRVATIILFWTFQLLRISFTRKRLCTFVFLKLEYLSIIYFKKLTITICYNYKCFWRKNNATKFGAFVFYNKNILQTRLMTLKNFNLYYYNIEESKSSSEYKNICQKL